MAKTVEAVYEGGAFKPREPVNLSEGQLVDIEIKTPLERAEDVLELAGRVYDGLSDQQINEIESIALDRSGWHRD